MYSALKKSLCVVQLLCMACSIQANWTSELKDIFKICAIAGTSVFIYAKWFEQSKLVDNSSLQEGVTLDGQEIKKLNEEVENLKKHVEELDQKKDNRELVTERNSVYERRNQADIASGDEVESLREILQKAYDREEAKNNLSWEEVEKIRKFLKENDDTVAPDYEELFKLLQKCSGQIVELTEKQTEIEKKHNQFAGEQVRIAKILAGHNNKITQHTTIIGNGVESAAIADLLQKLNEACPKQHTDTQKQVFDTYLEEGSSAKQEKERACSFQTLSGNGTANSNVITVTQLGALLINSFLELNGKFMTLKKTMEDEFPLIHSSIIFNAPN